MINKEYSKFVGDKFKLSFKDARIEALERELVFYQHKAEFLQAQIDIIKLNKE